MSVVSNKLAIANLKWKGAGGIQTRGSYHCSGSSIESTLLMSLYSYDYPIDSNRGHSANPSPIYHTKGVCLNVHVPVSSGHLASGETFSLAFGICKVVEEKHKQDIGKEKIEIKVMN
ncbi:hypothetical protein VNO77_45124 [Canavalia gladiata]|uniref:Uncharacterized protein n=1 Tax=Canavalia gladiata TaxID=3824 RepID=A0AAN9JS93_CANGL